MATENSDTRITATDFSAVRVRSQEMSADELHTFRSAIQKWAKEIDQWLSDPASRSRVTPVACARESEVLVKEDGHRRPGATMLTISVILEKE